MSAILSALCVLSLGAPAISLSVWLASRLPLSWRGRRLLHLLRGRLITIRLCSKGVWDKGASQVNLLRTCFLETWFQPLDLFEITVELLREESLSSLTLLLLWAFFRHPMLTLFRQVISLLLQFWVLALLHEHFPALVVLFLGNFSLIPFLLSYQLSQHVWQIGIPACWLFMLWWLRLASK